MAAALSLFEAAAADAHAGAQFMTAELLRSGSGGAEDEARAVRLLHAAAVRGHRMARQEVLRLLDADALQQHGAPSSVEPARARAERLPALDGGGEHFGVYRGDGTAATLGELLDAAARSDVVVLGEVHDDPVGHALEAYVLAKLAARRPVALSLEMFDADVQPVVDDYCCGLVSERDFLLDARPWDNYATDYRPLVEFARQCGLRVLAANAPRRYVSAVGARRRRRRARRRRAAGGRGGVPDSWPAAALQRLPPLPLPPLSDDYMEHLRSDPAVVRTDQMGLDDEFAAANHGGGGGGGDGLTGGARSSGCARATGCCSRCDSGTRRWRTRSRARSPTSPAASSSTSAARSTRCAASAASRSSRATGRRRRRSSSTCSPRPTRTSLSRSATAASATLWC